VRKRRGEGVRKRRGKREEGRGKREEGRGKREEGRGKREDRAVRFGDRLVTDGWAKRALVGWFISRAVRWGAHRYNKDGDENPKVWR